MATASSPAVHMGLRHANREARVLAAASNAWLWPVPIVHSDRQRTAWSTTMHVRNSAEGTGSPCALGEHRATLALGRGTHGGPAASHSRGGISQLTHLRAAANGTLRPQTLFEVDASVSLNVSRRGRTGSSGGGHKSNNNRGGTDPANSNSTYKDMYSEWSGSNRQLCATSVRLLPVMPSNHGSSVARGDTRVTEGRLAAGHAPSNTNTYAGWTSYVQPKARVPGSSRFSNGFPHARSGLGKSLSFLSRDARCSRPLCAAGSACGGRSYKYASGISACLIGCDTSGFDEGFKDNTWTSCSSSCVQRCGSSSSSFPCLVCSSGNTIGCGNRHCQGTGSCGAAWQALWLRCYSSSRSRSVRLELLRQQWPLIRQEMVDFFRSQVHVGGDGSRHAGGEAGDAGGAVREAGGNTRENKLWVNSQDVGSSGAAFDHSSSIISRCGSHSFKGNFSVSEEYSRGIYSMRARSGKVNILCRPWERFVRKEELQRANYVPCIVEKYGVERRLAIHRETLEALAFEEEHGHLSHFFQARLFRLHIGSWIEECIVTYVQADPVARRLYFVKFDRHVPGTISEVDVPTTLVGLLACPAYQKGCHVELVMPTIRCQCVGADLPPPIFVDISRLRFRPPYSAVTVADLQGALPRDGTARFHPAYGNLQRQEVVWAYEVGTLPEAPLPDEFVDPNFINRKGQKMDVMFHRQFPN